MKASLEDLKHQEQLQKEEDEILQQALAMSLNIDKEIEIDEYKEYNMPEQQQEIIQDKVSSPIENEEILEVPKPIEVSIYVKDLVSENKSEPSLNVEKANEKSIIDSINSGLKPIKIVAKPTSYNQPLFRPDPKLIAPKLVTSSKPAISIKPDNVAPIQTKKIETNINVIKEASEANAAKIQEQRQLLITKAKLEMYYFLIYIFFIN